VKFPLQFLDYTTLGNESYSDQTSHASPTTHTHTPPDFDWLQVYIKSWMHNGTPES